MARMKVEFLSHYKARHGYTFKDRLIGSLPQYASFASAVPWLANLRDSVPGAPWLSEKLLGLSARRSLPRWRSNTFWRSHDPTLFSGASAVLQAAAAQAPCAMLFVDTFNGTFESENSLAAARVLRAAGYTLHTLNKGSSHYCCGRTYLSVGMIEQAKAKAQALLNSLLPFARAGVPIVGLEPSCLLTLRDEFLVLGLGEGANILAKNAFLFEEFIARELKAGRFKLPLRTLNKPLLVHGHCHQKAFGAITPIMETLRLIPGAKPELIGSSCCGMAGSFGYDADHYELSMQMAESNLLPAIRKAPEATLVADGVSCRHQIRDGTGREALHAARLLETLILN
jgi:Fe-S oxidoreductase